MELFTLTRSIATYSIPQYIICDYEYTFPLSDSTAFISIELPGLTSETSYIREGYRTDITGKSYIIDLKSLSISCNSTNFDIKILNKGSESYIDTIHEVVSYSAINKSESDLFTQFIIANGDVESTNQLYMKIINNDIVYPGTILLQLMYVTLQDREF